MIYATLAVTPEGRLIKQGSVEDVTHLVAQALGFSGAKPKANNTRPGAWEVLAITHEGRLIGWATQKDYTSVVAKNFVSEEDAIRVSQLEHQIAVLQAQRNALTTP